MIGVGSAVGALFRRCVLVLILAAQENELRALRTRLVGYYGEGEGEGEPYSRINGAEKRTAEMIGEWEGEEMKVKETMVWELSGR